MNAQATSHIPHSPSRTVRIKRLRDEHDRFPGILDDSVFQRLHENAFVIHNGDSRDLVAAYALWTIIDQDGRLYTREYMVDIYAASMPTSVILAGKDIILSPNGWIFPHEYSDARRAFDAQSINLLDSRLTQATKISLSIDAVIFADGETCGDNTKRLDQAIVARRNAAISLAAKARVRWRAESQQSLLKTCSSRAKTSLPKASGEAILAVIFPECRIGTHICAIFRVFHGLLRSTPPGVQTDS
jgi:hypothetical protein